MGTKGKHVGGVLTFYDGVSHERLLPVSPVVFMDDFNGADLVIPAAGSEESGCPWAKVIVGAAPPTVAKVADAASGVVACTLTSDSQAQTAALDMGDQRNFSVEQGLIFECRAKLSVLPTLVAEIQFGLAGDNGVPDSIAQSLFFDADGSGAIKCATDDGTTDSGPIASGVTVLATEWHIYRIECLDVTDIRFYIDGVHVATGTTFAFAATGANAILQPWIGAYKASGAGVGTIQVDYIKCWQNRS